MTTPILLLSSNILVFMMAMFVMIYFAPFFKMPAIRWLLVLVGSFCIVSFCTLGVYISGSIESQIFFSRMRFLSLGLMPASWLMFLATVYGRWMWIQKKWVTAIILLPGCITTILTLFSSTQNLIIKDFSAIKIHSFNVLTYSTGSWFNVHYIWAMLLVVTSVALGVYLFVKERGIRRQQVVIITLGSTLAAAVDIYCVLSNSPLRWLMLASGTYLVSQMGIVFSALKLKLLNIIPLAMKKVFDEFPDPVIVIDGDSIVKKANRSAVHFFKLNSPVGKFIKDLLPKINLQSDEISVEDENGEKHFFNLTREKLDTDSGLQTGQVLFFRQITLQKMIENRLNQNLEFKARLLALIAHDLSGHMENQAVLTASLKEQMPEVPLKERVGLLADAAMASQGLVENMMSWVHRHGNQFNVLEKNFEWNLLIKECMEELLPLRKLKNVHIDFESEIRPLITKGDSDMMTSVIRNILANAIRATAENKKIDIRLSVIENSKVKLVISDEGEGISKEMLVAIREIPSYFDLTHKVSAKGYGIGLMIVKNFITLHEGEFNIDSELGRGTQVSIYIPLR